MENALNTLMDQAGALGCCVVDSSSGMMLASMGGGPVDLELAAAGNTEVVRAKLRTMKSLNLQDHIEDILITLGKHFHLIRPLEKNPEMFIYLVIDKNKGNLALARRALTSADHDIVPPR